MTMHPESSSVSPPPSHETPLPEIWTPIIGPSPRGLMAKLFNVRPAAVRWVYGASEPDGALRGVATANGTAMVTTVIAGGRSRLNTRFLLVSDQPLQGVGTFGAHTHHLACEVWTAQGWIAGPDADRIRLACPYLDLYWYRLAIQATGTFGVCLRAALPMRLTFSASEEDSRNSGCG